MNLRRYFKPRKLWVIEFFKENSMCWEPSAWVALSRSRIRDINKDRREFNKMVGAKTRIRKYHRETLD